MPDMDGLEAARSIRVRESAIGKGTEPAPAGSAYADPARAPRPHPDRRADRSRDEERRGALPRCRHGRLCLEARMVEQRSPGPWSASRSRPTHRLRGHRSTSPWPFGIDSSTVTSSSPGGASPRSLRRGMASPAAKSCDQRCTRWTPPAWSATFTASRARPPRWAAGAPARSRARSRRSRGTATSTARPRGLSSSKVRSQRSSPSSPCPAGARYTPRSEAGGSNRGACDLRAFALDLVCPGGLMALARPRVPMIEQDILGGCAWSPGDACARLSGSCRRPGPCLRRDRRGGEVAAGLGDGPDRGARARPVPPRRRAAR